MFLFSNSTAIPYISLHGLRSEPSELGVFSLFTSRLCCTVHYAPILVFSTEVLLCLYVGGGKSFIFYQMFICSAQINCNFSLFVFCWSFKILAILVFKCFLMFSFHWPREEEVWTWLLNLVRQEPARGLVVFQLESPQNARVIRRQCCEQSCRT